MARGQKVMGEVVKVHISRITIQWMAFVQPYYGQLAYCKDECFYVTLKVPGGVGGAATICPCKLYAGA